MRCYLSKRKKILYKISINLQFKIVQIYPYFFSILFFFFHILHLSLQCFTVFYFILYFLKEKRSLSKMLTMSYYFIFLIFDSN